MIQPPITALEEAQRGSSWLEDLVAFLITCASWEHLSWPVYLHTHTHTHKCCLFWSILSGLIRSDDSVCLNVFISSDFVIFPHPCDFFFFSKGLGGLHSSPLPDVQVLFGSLTTPILSSFPQVPISHSPHILHSLRRRVLCPPPHPGTSQNSPVTPYVLVPCLHFPPSSPPLPTLYLPPALHSTLCFTLACLPPNLNEQSAFLWPIFPKTFLGDLWCGLIQLSSLSLAKNRDKMDDANHHKNWEHCSNEHSKFRSTPNCPECFYLFFITYLFIWLISGTI